MVIVILIMMLLTLIVTSMTKNANREQRQALDRQLSSQAFYAAESGINDARDYYTQFANDPVSPAPASKDDCSGLPGSLPGNQFPGMNYSSQVGDSTNIVSSYSCVIYDATPDSLVFSDVGVDKSVVMPIKDVSNAPIKSLTFTWKVPNNANYDFSGCPGSGFPQSLSNCDAGVLRVELIDPTNTNRDALINNDFLAYISPSSNVNSSPANPNYGSGRGTANQGVSWRGGCTGGSDGECSITINNINQSVLLLHLRSIYNENQVTVTGKIVDPNPPNPVRAVKFKDGQMLIDSTGKASDVLKGLGVRVPLNAYGNGLYPEFSLQTSDAVCKLQQIVPSSLSGASSSDNCP